MYCRKCKPKKVRMTRLFQGVVFRCPKCGWILDRSKNHQKVVVGR